MTALLVSGIVAYIGTNIDGMILLIGLLAAEPDRPADIFRGLCLGMAALLLAAILCSGFAPVRFAGLLGVVPVGFGIVRLAFPQETKAADHLHGMATGILSVAALVIAAGGDNLAVYIPLFAAQATGGKVLLVVLFSALTAIWFLVARLLVQQAAAIRPFAEHGAARLGPLVMVGLGLCLMLRSGGPGLIPAAAELVP